MNGKVRRETDGQVFYVCIMYFLYPGRESRRWLSCWQPFEKPDLMNAVIIQEQARERASRRKRERSVSNEKFPWLWLPRQMQQQYVSSLTSSNSVPSPRSFPYLCCCCCDHVALRDCSQTVSHLVLPRPKSHLEFYCTFYTNVRAILNWKIFFSASTNIVLYYEHGTEIETRLGRKTRKKSASFSQTVLNYYERRSSNAALYTSMNVVVEH